MWWDLIVHFFPFLIRDTTKILILSGFDDLLGGLLSPLLFPVLPILNHIQDSISCFLSHNEVRQEEGLEVVLPVKGMGEVKSEGLVQITGSSLFEVCDLGQALSLNFLICNMR